MNYDIIEKIKGEIKGFKFGSRLEEFGRIIEAADGIVRISGLSGALSQEILTIETDSGDVPALAFNLEETVIGGVLLGDVERVRVGDTVKKTGKVLSIKVGEEIVGRVVDSLGVPVDGKGVIFSGKKEIKENPLENSAPSVLSRSSVNVPLHTGIKAIDAMIPIGRGQRELIIGDRQTGKTSIALDVILNQKQDINNGQVICIYVAIGQKTSKIAKIVRSLEEFRAMDYTVVVSAPASAPAAMQYLAPLTGAAIGEYFRDKGRDALVIYDDLSKHADAYRQLSLLLRRPPGREAYPGDIFYLHSRLLERSAKLDKGHGGGSLTALPIIETKLGDVSAYVPTNVISITDGQIYLESALFFKGVRPAVNVGLSVSRVGSAAQTKVMKKVAGKLRLDLVQFRELQAFLQFASELDPATKKKIVRGELLTELLKQTDGEPMSFEKQATIIYAALNGFMDSIPVSDIKPFETEFIKFISNMHDIDILSPLRETGALDEATETKLKLAVEEFKNIKK
ncbi:MAG: F0F1 ATP synthase subunit alpha [Candidatus Vogelbacteria bacterium]|nr:F0F1 ATP synthase subunit alpha [Candidatus Vogelbacteria bacterium]